VGTYGRSSDDDDDAGGGGVPLVVDDAKPAFAELLVSASETTAIAKDKRSSIQQTIESEDIDDNIVW
jgi:hypothetical protein